MILDFSGKDDIIIEITRNSESFDSIAKRRGAIFPTRNNDYLARRKRGEGGGGEPTFETSPSPGIGYNRIERTHAGAANSPGPGMVPYFRVLNLMYFDITAGAGNNLREIQRCANSNFLPEETETTYQSSSFPGFPTVLIFSPFSDEFQAHTEFVRIKEKAANKLWSPYTVLTLNFPAGVYNGFIGDMDELFFTNDDIYSGINVFT